MNVARVVGVAGLIVFGVLAGPASAQTCQATVVIDAAGKIHDPARMKCLPDEEVKWEVDNQFEHDLDVSFVGFKEEPTGKLGHPLKGTPPSVSPKKKAKKSSSGIYVKSKANFGVGSNKLPYTVYKYTITARDAETKKYLTPLDPELEVTPPPTIGPKGRGRGGR